MTRRQGEGAMNGQEKNEQRSETESGIALDWFESLRVPQELARSEPLIYTVLH